MNVFLATLCEFLPGVIVLSGPGQRMYSWLHCVSFFQVLLCCPDMVSECILGYIVSAISKCCLIILDNDVVSISIETPPGKLTTALFYKQTESMVVMGQAVYPRETMTR